MSEPPPVPAICDGELLRQYHETKSEGAFTELVQRHVGLVRSAALRRVGGDAHLADDVTQRVFSDLARKAAQLKERPVLAGWLYTSTRFAAAHAVRTEQRRRTHELEAHAMTELDETPEPEWTHLRPVIDEAMDDLEDRERDLVLLRYFENLPLSEVGARFAVSPDAARMRLDRALEKLRRLLAKRGVDSTTTALAVAIGAHSGSAAPAGYVAGIVARALGNAAVRTATPIAIWKLLIGTAALVAALWFGVSGVTTPRQAAKLPPDTESPGSAADASSIIGTELVDTAGPPGVIATPAPVSSGPIARANEFAALSEMEKFILKTLWEHERVSPNKPPQRWAFRPGQTSPELAAFQEAAVTLRTKRLVGIGAQGGAFLTDAGGVFVRAQEEALDAFTASAAEALFQSRMRSDAAYRAEIIARAKSRLDDLFGPLLKSLAVSQERLDSFKSLLIEQQLVGLETRDVMSTIGLPAVDHPNVFSTSVVGALAGIDASIRSSLSETDYARYVEYSKELPQWIALNELGKKLQSSPTPLSDDQTSRLLEVFRGLRTATAAKVALRIHYGSGVFPTKLPNPVTDEALARAGPILIGSQLEALRQVQQQWGKP